MYVLRVTDIAPQFIGNNLIATSNKVAAKLFNTVDEAKECVRTMREKNLTPGEIASPIEILEVETKPILHKVIGRIEVV